jgi:hypothetical protein
MDKHWHNTMNNKVPFFSFLFLTLASSSINAVISIDKPGEYTLEGSYQGPDNVVVIAASNVKVDLAGRTLSSATTGITINSGLSNITIKNGFIDNCTVGIAIKDGCAFIRIKDIEITNCSNCAVQVAGTSSNEINSIIFKRLKMHLSCTQGTTNNIIQIDYTNDIILSDCLMTKNGDSSTDLHGISLSHCSNGLFENIKISANVGKTFYGVYIDNSSDCFFNHCNVRSNIATNNLTGFCFTGGAATSGNLCEKCYALNNNSTNGPINGFELLALVTQNILQECTAAGNMTNGGLSTSNCYGFNLDQATFCSVVKCRALYNSAPISGNFDHYCAGFNIGTSAGGSTGTKSCEFTDNVAIGNNGHNDNSSYGIRAQSNTPSGNANNIYFSNIGARNGPTNPSSNNQITSNTGGVPIGSVQTDNTNGLNGQTIQYSNLRIT